jgi:glycosyltransferase involved in cell wall biosynthesis
LECGRPELRWMTQGSCVSSMNLPINDITGWPMWNEHQVNRLGGELCSKVSVAILSYNRPEYLREALRSVIDQKVQPLEIVIFDNGSKDDVRKSVADLIGGIVEWNGWTPHSSVENFQRAFAFGRGEYLYVMHDDDRLLPDFIGEMSAYLDAHDVMAGVACNGNCIDVDGERTGAMLLRRRLGDKIFRDRSELAAQYADSYIPFPTVVYRRKHMSKLAIKQEYGKLWDGIFLCDLAGQGPVAYLDRALIEYRVHPQQDSVEFPEPQYRLKEDYVMEATATSPLGGRSNRIISRQRAKRTAERLGKQLLGERGAAKLLRSLPTESHSSSRFWLLCYLMNPGHLVRVYLRRFGLR